MKLPEFLKKSIDIEAKATGKPWNFEEERYSAKCVIGQLPHNDFWIAHCQPENNGYENGQFIAHSRNVFRTLLEIVEIQREALEKIEKMHQFIGFPPHAPTATDAISAVEKLIG